MTHSHPQSHPSKLFASDIATFSDTELDQYLEVNGRCIHVEDPENLSQAFIERLRARADPTEAPQSHLIDPDSLIVRLEDIAADRQAPPPPSPPSSLATTEDLGEEEYNRQDLEQETECYNTLINEGGRPSHPISLGRDVAKDPGEYREILLFWQTQIGNLDEWKVFHFQMCDWREFREYQKHHRKEGRFPKYVELVKRSLTKHGFTRSFELCADSEQQSRLNTWIEFLDYEYWLYDKDMRFVRRRQSKYDEAWKELVSSNVLRSFETEEFICSIDSAFFHQSERDEAERAVNFAKSIVISAQKSVTNLQPLSLVEKERQQHLREAQSKLNAAVEVLASIKRRSDLTYKFFTKTGKTQYTDDGRVQRSYLGVKGEAENRSILLRWILQQIPLIELELTSANMAQKNSSKPGLRAQRGSKRGRADEADGEICSKRQKQDGDGNANLGESHFNYRQHDSEIDMLSLMRPNNSKLAIDSRPIREPVACKSRTKNAFKPTASKKAKARSRHHTAPRKDTLLARDVVLRRTPASEARRENGISRNISALGPLMRRNTRARKPPDRFQ